MYQPSTLPQTGYLRLHDIIGRRADPKGKRPAIPALYPVGRSTFLRMVATGKAPQPVKLSPGVTAWRVEDILAWLEAAAAKAAA